MQLPAGIRPDERILVLGIPPLDVIAGLSRGLPQGIVVALGDPELVSAARKGIAHLKNVMVVPGTPDEIPWRDGFFTRVLDAVGNWPDPEAVRRESARVTQASYG